MYTEPPALIAVLWQLRTAVWWASAEFWTHPRGVELRVLDGPELRWSRVRETKELAEVDARETYSRLQNNSQS